MHLLSFVDIAATTSNNIIASPKQAVSPSEMRSNARLFAIRKSKAVNGESVRVVLPLDLSKHQP